MPCNSLRRHSPWIPTLLCFVAASSTLVVSTRSAIAQITLRPNSLPGLVETDDFQGSSRREVHISRGGSNAANVRSLPTGKDIGYSADASREAEYEDLQREADAMERQLGLIRRIVKFAGPSIVHLEATKRSDPGKGFASSRIEEAGAGVIVDIGGRPYILTNRHVIYPAEVSAIRVELNNGQALKPTRVWTDASTDVAVMALDSNDVIAARLGDSDALDIGDFVLAVGSPFGLSHSVTYGILSAKGRRNLELGSKEIKIQDFFQTDAAINPGNSGGPLLNLRGEVVGINTAIASNSGGNEGIGFSIPINMAIVVAEQLITRGELSRSYLGVVLENNFDGATAQRLGLPTNSGALVKSIIPNSPAERAGILIGDVILEFQGLPIDNDGHLVKTVGLTPVGSQVSVLIFRNESQLRLTTRLDPNPDP